MTTEDLIWLRSTPLLRAPATGPSAEQIAHEAFGIADVHGLAALSVKRVAGRLRITPRQLGTFLSSPEDLFDLMLDVALGEMLAELTSPASSSPGDWHAKLTTLAYAARASAQRHPWLPKLVGDRAPWGPNGLRYSERTLAALDGQHLSMAQTVDCVDSVLSFAYGYAQIEQTRSETVVSDDALHRARYLQERASSGDYPLLGRLFGESEELSSEQSFQSGLRIVLDGIALQIFGASAPPAVSPPAVSPPAVSSPAVSSPQPETPAETEAEPAAAEIPPEPTAPEPVAPHRRRRRFVIGGVLVGAAIITAVVATVVAVSSTPATTTPTAHRPPAVAAPTSAAPAAFSTVTDYLKAAVPLDATIAADPTVGAELTGSGFSHVVAIGAALPNEYVVSTPALRSAALPGTVTDRLLATSVPVASFGNGSSAVIVEQTSADGGSGYQSRRAADSVARKRAEPELLQNPAIHADPSARAALSSGALDMRAATVIALLAANGPVEIMSVSPSPPEQAAGLPIRVIAIKADAAAVQKGIDGLVGDFRPGVSPTGSGTLQLSWPLAGEPPTQVPSD